MVEVIRFQAPNTWPNILIFWAIHGNEPCWTLAIKKVIQQLRNNQIILHKGSVTFVPIANKPAYELNKRYIDQDLNRIIWKYTSPTTVEQSISQELISLIEECDILLDIHSTTESSPAFVFQDFSD